MLTILIVFSETQVTPVLMVLVAIAKGIAPLRQYMMTRCFPAQPPEIVQNATEYEFISFFLLNEMKLTIEQCTAGPRPTGARMRSVAS